MYTDKVHTFKDFFFGAALFVIGKMNSLHKLTLVIVCSFAHLADSKNMCN